MSEQESSQEQAAQPKADAPEEAAFMTAINQRNIVSKALKEGTLACLTGDTSPAVNISTGTRYTGANQLYLKEHQRNFNFPTAEYLTKDAIEKAGFTVNPDAEGPSINFSTLNKDSEKWETKNTKLYNIAQTSDPEKLKGFYAEQEAQKLQEKTDYIKQTYGKDWKPSEPKPGQDIVCNSTDPEKYLGQYFAAVQQGSKFVATKEQAAEFGQKFNDKLFAKKENGYPDPFSLDKTCRAAQKEAQNIISPKIEQKQELKLSKSQHM